MRIATDTKVFETTGVLEAHRATIESSRKTIRMMIDGIYADKELAVVRELSTNAGDSHRRAKQTAAFYVHAPTPIKPEFFVRDYGVGMTHEKIVSTYIVLGKSDKDQSNDEAGMWGLGALAPFSKADQYYITCFDGVEARHYGFGIAEDGTPTLVLMGKEECDEPCGVRVGLSVEAKDFSLFEQAVKKVAIGFGAQMESNISLPGPGELMFKGEDWTVYRAQGLPYSSKWLLRQGGVLYPLDASRITTPKDSRCLFILDCEIGKVKMTTSREAIAYTDETTEYLTNRVDQLQVAIFDAIMDEVKDIPDAGTFFSEVKKRQPNFTLAKNFIHPATGLGADQVQATSGQVFFEAIEDASNGRWTFNALTSLPISGEKSPVRAFLIDDIAPYLDPSRVSEVSSRGLTASETRRLSRLARAYLMTLKQSKGLFLFNTEYDAAWWKAAMPGLSTVKLTFDEVRASIPRRAVPEPTTRRTIKGIAFAMAAGDQRPVSQIVNEPGKYAWVTSEQWRQGSGSLFKLALRFEVKGLYIVGVNSDAKALMEEQGVPPFLALVETALEAKGSSAEGWVKSHTYISTTAARNAMDLVRRIKIEAPDAFAQLAKSRGVFAKLAVALEGLPQIDIPAASDEERRAVEILHGSFKGVKMPQEYVEIIKLLKPLDNYYHPLCQFLTSATYLKTADLLARAAKTVVSLERTFPLTLKINGYS